MSLNLRRHVIPKSEDIDYLLLDEKATRLTPNMIKYLEYYVPLKIGNIFEKLGFDGMETRKDLLEKVKEKKISLKVAQLEIRRRKKIKVV